MQAEVVAIWDQGGFVMPPLMLCCVALWYNLGARAAVVFGQPDSRQAIEGGAVVIRTVVMVAPLLGLLGTVTGMIETFASLSDMAMFSRTGGISGGISQALVSTQVGLAVAIPGILLGRLLDKTARRRLAELDEVLR